MAKKCSVKEEPREVIAGQLLVALEDKSMVAVLADARMLSALLTSVLSYQTYLNGENREYFLSLAKDLQQLEKEAFGG